MHIFAHINVILNVDTYGYMFLGLHWMSYKLRLYCIPSYYSMWSWWNLFILLPCGFFLDYLFLTMYAWMCDWLYSFWIFAMHKLYNINIYLKSLPGIWKTCLWWSYEKLTTLVNHRLKRNSLIIGHEHALGKSLI